HRRNLVTVELDGIGTAYRRNILVDTFRELVTRHQAVGIAQRHFYTFDEFARFAILLAVVEIQVFQRQFAATRAFAQYHDGTHRDQSRSSIANRRAVREIAYQSAGVADRGRS